MSCSKLHSPMKRLQKLAARRFGGGRLLCQSHDACNERNSRTTPTSSSPSLRTDSTKSDALRSHSKGASMLLDRVDQRRLRGQSSHARLKVGEGAVVAVVCHRQLDERQIGSGVSCTPLVGLRHNSCGDVQHGHRLRHVPRLMMQQHAAADEIRRYARGLLDEPRACRL